LPRPASSSLCQSRRKSAPVYRGHSVAMRILRRSFAERTQSRRDHREFPNSRLAKNLHAVAWPCTKKSPVWFLERGAQNQNWER
jgi:hypothetical protein